VEFPEFHPITNKEIVAIDIVRSQSMHPQTRTFYSNGERIVIKEMPISAHARAASFIQTKLMTAIVRLPNDASKVS